MTAFLDKLKAFAPYAVLMLLVSMWSSGKLQPYIIYVFVASLVVCLSMILHEGHLIPAPIMHLIGLTKEKKAEFDETAKAKVEEQMQIKYRERLGNFDAPRYTRLLQDRVHGQDAAIEQIVASLKSHFSKPNPRQPLVISIIGSKLSGKSTLAQAVIDLVQTEINRSGNQSCELNCGNDGEIDVADLAKRQGVVLIRNASKLVKTRADSTNMAALRDLFSGNSARDDRYLIVILTDRVETSDIRNFHEGSVDQQSARRKELLKALYAGLGETISLPIIFEPYNQMSAAMSIWKTLQGIVLHEFRLTLNDPTTDVEEAFLDWMVPPVSDVISGDKDVTEAVALVRSQIEPFLVAAAERYASLYDDEDVAARSVSITFDEEVHPFLLDANGEILE